LNKRGIKAELRYYWEITPEKVAASEHSIINNFVIMPADQLGLYLPSRLYRWGVPSQTYTQAEWQQLCAIYCQCSENYAERRERIKTAQKRIRSFIIGSSMNLLYRTIKLPVRLLSYLQRWRKEWRNSVPLRNNLSLDE
jgi:hypothetical protein